MGAVIPEGPGIWIPIDTEDDGEPYYSWQEDMSHRAEADRIPYDQWLKREVNKVSTLWDLVNKWQDQARAHEGGPYLSPKPEIAHAQALNAAADDLSDVLLD